MASANFRKFWGIFWIPASTEKRIQTWFFEIGRELGLEENVSSIKRHLSGVSEDFLMIFDDASATSSGLAEYFPRTTKVTIIINSSSWDGFKLWATIGSSEVGPFDEEEAVDLVLKLTAGTVSSNAQSRESAIMKRRFSKFFK